MSSNLWRKKPVVIEARQFTPETALEVALWCHGTIKEPPVGITSQVIVIATLEGDHTALPGDYIIRGVQGEFYPCKPEIFAATYEPASVPVLPSAAPSEAALDAALSRLTSVWDILDGPSQREPLRQALCDAYAVDARPLSERPECDEAVARALFRRRCPAGEWTPGAPNTEQALEDVREVRAAERTAGGNDG